MADTKLTHKLVLWDHLPNKSGNYPLIFHGVMVSITTKLYIKYQENIEGKIWRFIQNIYLKNIILLQ